MDHAIRTYDTQSVFDAQHIASICSPDVHESMEKLGKCFKRNPEMCRGLAKLFGLDDCGTFERVKSETLQHIYNVVRLAVARAVGRFTHDASGAEPLLLTAPPEYQLPEDLTPGEGWDPEGPKAVTYSWNITAEPTDRMQTAIVFFDNFLKADGSPPEEKMSHEIGHFLESKVAKLSMIEMEKAGEISKEDVFIYREMMPQALNGHLMTRFFNSTWETGRWKTNKLFLDTLSYATGIRPLTQEAYEDGLLMAVVGPSSLEIYAGSKNSVPSVGRATRSRKRNY